MKTDEQLRREIQDLQRDLRDPYLQDKWVERKMIEELQRELDNRNANN